MIISFFIIENGIHLLIIGMIPHMSKFIEISLTFNFVVAIIFLVYLILRLNEVFLQEKLKNLKNQAFRGESNEL